MCLAVRVGRRCKAVDVIESVEEVLKQYPVLTHLQINFHAPCVAFALLRMAHVKQLAEGSPWNRF